MIDDKKLRIAIYARVSRADLNLENQLEPLRRRALAENWQYEIFTEQESTRHTRPIKEVILKKLRNKELDGVCVYALDRWCRSVSEFAGELEEFNRRNIKFYSLREGFAFDTAMGMAMAQMAMVFAQLERDLIRERTHQGLKSANAKGKILGRHPVGCGCGFTSKNRRIQHDGKIMPIRDNNHMIVGWQIPSGEKLRGFSKRKLEIKPPPVSIGSLQTD